jgi:ribosomal protein L3
VQLVDAEKGLIAVCGGVPGPPGGLVIVTRPAQTGAKKPDQGGE